MAIGQALADLNARVIRQMGVAVTRVRRPSADGGATSSATLYAVVVPLGAKESAALYVEGVDNVAEANPHQFVFAADADVDAATDWLEWDGTVWRLLNVTSQPVAGAAVSRKLYGVRERAA